MPWLLITAAGAVGGWIGSLTGAAVANTTNPAAPAEPPYRTIFLYAALAGGMVYVAKRAKVI